MQLTKFVKIHIIESIMLIILIYATYAKNNLLVLISLIIIAILTAIAIIDVDKNINSDKNESESVESTL